MPLTQREGKADKKGPVKETVSVQKKKTTAGERGGVGRLSVPYLVLPALLLGGVAVAVYLGEAWLLGPRVSSPLPLPKAVSNSWRTGDSYLTRLWGTYR